MRNFLAIVLSLCIVGIAADYAQSNTVSEKDHAHFNRVEGSNPRQGGDTISDATVIDGLPFFEAGTTAGYTDDYDEVCYYSGSTSPDVVYSLTTAGDMAVDVDLCGSSYDTKVYMYDEGMNLVACNDDFYFDEVCGQYVSKLENVLLMGGNTYYIVIDGFDGDFGDYLIDVQGFDACVIECPNGGIPEGEPELMNGYVDMYNGGCRSSNSDPLSYTQVLQQGNFCGISGWYDSGTRDEDWFVITLAEDGFVTLTCDAEQATHVLELLGMPSCANIEIGQTITAGPCLPATMNIYGAPGSHVYLLAVPTTYFPPAGFVGHEYDYICHVDTGMETGIVVGSTPKTALKGAHPNPFNPLTNVSFSLASEQQVKVSIFDMRGRPVVNLVNRVYSAGEHTLPWNGRDAGGRDMPSGTYLVRLETESGVEASKVSLIR